MIRPCGSAGKVAQSRPDLTEPHIPNGECDFLFAWLNLFEGLAAAGEFGEDGIDRWVQTNGFGLSFRAARNSLIVAMSSLIPNKESRRMRSVHGRNFRNASFREQGGFSFAWQRVMNRSGREHVVRA